jgi:hypothetical protein
MRARAREAVATIETLTLKNWDTTAAHIVAVVDVRDATPRASILDLANDALALADEVERLRAWQAQAWRDHLG